MAVPTVLSSDLGDLSVPRTLAGKTLFITGASRGIGLAIALRAARDGANIVIAAKTAKAHPKLPGTIHSAAAAVECAGGMALPLIVDVRNEEDIAAAVSACVARFGGIDVLVNNASAINLATTEQIESKRFDLLHQINVRGTFLTTRTCIPHLRHANNPHVLTLSPPLSMRADWFAEHLPYTLSKYGMSMCTLAWAEEFAPAGIACNSLWPRTTIATSAVEFALGGPDMMRESRTPEIVADAAHVILTSPASRLTGRFLIDDEVLVAAGTKHLERYSVRRGAVLESDIFIDPRAEAPLGVQLK